MRLELNADACTGHGRCYALAPEVFEPDDEGHCLIIVDGDVPPELEAAARKGVINCPEGALKIIVTP